MSESCGLLDLTEDDVLEAMRSMQGYVDITPGTFREIYALAYEMALTRMRSMGQAKDIMTSPVHVLRQGMSAFDAAKIMASHGISGTPVVTAQNVIRGVVSEKDFLRVMGLPGTASFMAVISSWLEASTRIMPDFGAMRIDDIMTAPPLTALPETTLADISNIFTERAINRLPVCDPEGHVLGIVTRSDLVASLCGR
ncbi:hypothetical protein MASR1M90_08290 [Desulfovibrionales bacterium]